VDCQVQDAQLDVKIYKEKKLTRDSLTIRDELVALAHQVLQVIYDMKSC
jgi:hypothetical protein